MFKSQQFNWGLLSLAFVLSGCNLGENKEQSETKAAQETKLRVLNVLMKICTMMCILRVQ